MTALGDIVVGQLRKRGAGQVWEVRKIDQATCPYTTAGVRLAAGDWQVWLWPTDPDAPAVGEAFPPDVVTRRFKLVAA